MQNLIIHFQKQAFSISAIESQLPNTPIRGAQPGTLLGLAIPYIFPIAGFILLVYIAFGGFALMTSQGNPDNIQKGKGIITTAVVGFFIVFLAYWVTYLVGKMLGLDDILTTFSSPII